MAEPIKVCAIRQLEGEQLIEAAWMAREAEPENAPTMAVGTTVGNTDDDFRIAQAILSGKKWPQNHNIRISFLRATAGQADFIKGVAQEWFNEINLKPVWVDRDGDIRISVHDGGGSWSFLSTDCWGIRNMHEPTMVFGWLNEAVVRHEFGHGVMGMVHEHQHPERGFTLDREATYRLFGGPPNNWDRATIDHNVINVVPRDQTNFSKYASDSIMHYFLDERITVGDFSVGHNTVLSPSDRAFARSIYPRHAPPPPPKKRDWETFGWMEVERIRPTTGEAIWGYRAPDNPNGIGTWAEHGWFERHDHGGKRVTYFKPQA